MAGEPEVVGEEQQHEPGVGHEVPRDDAPWTEKQRHLGSLRDLVRDCCSEAADLFKVSVSVRWWTRGLGLGRGPAQAGVGGYDAGRVLGHVGRRRPRDGDLGSLQIRAGESLTPSPLIPAGCPDRWACSTTASFFCGKATASTSEIRRRRFGPGRVLGEPNRSPVRTHRTGSSLGVDSPREGQPPAGLPRRGQRHGRTRRLLRRLTDCYGAME